MNIPAVIFLFNEGRGNPGHKKIRLYGKESEETREDKNKLSQILPNEQLHGRLQNNSNY